MGISDELTRQFAKETVGKSDRDTGKTVTGTAVKYNGSMYVRIDGSDQITPIISSTVGMKEGDRVTVLIKDHTTTVTGNTTAPSISQDDVNSSNQEIVDKITEVEILVAEKASIKDLEAESARIDDLVADNVTIKDTLTASKAEIDQLKAKDVEISGNLTAQNAEIENLKTTKLDTEIADIKYATIGSLEATNANIHNLKADYGEFKQLSTDKFAANDASIKKLEAEKANIKDLDAKYANIDFANIGKAAIENLFSKSGMIGDLVVGEGTITGTLVGVTIKGDLIEGGTVKADKLVVQGEDGLYYKLNVSAEKVSAQQTEYNSLNGSIITAKSITAEKVNVNDLVAFGATIGGFHITDSAIYSGVKESINNTTRGTYMDDDGQFAIGDGSNYLKFFRDSNGKYKLDISASSIRFGTSGETVENVVQDMVVKTETEYYISTSPTELSGGSWSLTSPTWSAGKYIWTRTKSTKKSGKVEYSNPACTTGAPGKDGVGTPGTPGKDGKTSYLHIAYANSADGTDGFSVSDSNGKLYIGQYTDFTEADSTDPKKYSWSKIKGSDGAAGVGVKTITNYYLATSAGSGVTTSTGGWTTTIQTITTDKKYLWNYEKIEYTNGKVDQTTPCIIGTYGKDGAPGSPGANGVGIKSITEYYQVSTSNTSAPSTWLTTVPSMTTVNRYLWNYERITYTNNSTSDTAKRVIGVYGDKGNTGDTGVGVKTSTVTYQASTSGTTIPSGSWVSTIPNVADGQYLWTRTVIAYTDGKTTTSYSVGKMGQNGSNGAPGKPGTDGKPGADGVGIKSTSVKYQAGSSQTTAPTGAWLDAVPKLSAATPYLWTKTVITYTNDTSSTSYSVSSTLDGVEVGGRNLAKKTSDEWSDWIDIPKLNQENATVNFNTIDMPDCKLEDMFTSYYEIEYMDVKQSENIPEGSKSSVRSNWYSIIDGNTVWDAPTYQWAHSPVNGVKVYTGTSPITEQFLKIEKIFINIRFDYVASGKLRIRKVKYEKGNKATDWTPAPEDVQSGIDDAFNSANDANNKIDLITPDIEFSKAQIEVLNKSISSLVVDQNGGSLMTQTQDGWQFNIGAIQTGLDKAMSDVTEIKGDISGVTDLANKTGELVNSIDKKTAYINMSQDSEGAPVLELGRKEGLFKVRITDTAIEFLEGSQKIAYITNRQLYIQSSVVTDEMKIGATNGYIWKKRGNGNMGLRYVTGGVVIYSTNYSYSQEAIDLYGTSGYTGIWSVNESLLDRGAYVGQNIVLLVKNTTKNHVTEYSVRINSIESEFRVNTTTVSMKD